jgi:hypothetical protein
MNYIHFRLNWLVIAIIFFTILTVIKKKYSKEIFKINIQKKYSKEIFKFIDKKNNI